MRIAEFPLRAGELPEHVEISGLPLALDDSSVRVRVEVDQGTAPLASDVRIGLAVPPPQETTNPPADEEIRAAAAEVRQIQDVIALIDNEIDVLRNLHVPNRPDGEPGKAPPPSPMSARLALANFSDEQIRDRIEEKRENLEKLHKVEEHLADLQQKQHQASTARDARPNELRKFDRHKGVALAAVPKLPAIANVSSVSMPPSPKPLPKYQPPQKVRAEQRRADVEQMAPPTISMMRIGASEEPMCTLALYRRPPRGYQGLPNCPTSQPATGTATGWTNGCLCQ